MTKEHPGQGEAHLGWHQVQVKFNFNLGKEMLPIYVHVPQGFRLFSKTITDWKDTYQDSLRKGRRNVDQDEEALKVAKIHCSSFLWHQSEFFQIHIPKWPNIIAPGFEKLSIALGFPLHSPAYLQRGQRGRGRRGSCSQPPDVHPLKVEM